MSIMRRSCRSVILWRLLAIGTGVGCATEATTNVPLLDGSNGCTTLVTPVVSDSARGQITWSPACGLRGLLVQRQRTDNPLSWDDLWFLQPWSTLIFPDVIYGELASGSIAPLNSSPPPLERGRTYRVTIFLDVFTNPFPSATWVVP